MFYNYALAELHRIKMYIKQIHQLLDNLPEGFFYCAHDKGRVKWYYSLNKKAHYISKKERTFAEKLAARRFLSSFLKDCEKEKTALEFYLRHHKLEMGKEAQALLEKPEYKELIKVHFKPLSKELQDWGNQPYPSNPNYPENLKFKTSSGRLVRSKSEALIEMLLTVNHIPFRYEEALEIGGVIYYPDFTIRHPVTGELFYWEHFGMIDSPAYRKNALSKLEQYIVHGMIPGVNLITTYETKDSQLDGDVIQKLIEQFFL